MTILPFKCSPREFNLILIMEKANIDRILSRDPAIVDLAKLPKIWNQCRLRHILICFANPAEIHAFAAVAKDDLPKAINILKKGLTFKLEDNDLPYQSEKDTQKN